MTFVLHPNLEKKIFVKELPLCRLLLEDEETYPWLILVPRRPDVSRMMELTAEDQIQLLHELNWAQKTVWDLFHPTQLNVAAIGNKTPQLHVHVIGRYQDDPAWPGTVWDHPYRRPYSAEKRDKIVDLLNTRF